MLLYPLKTEAAKEKIEIIPADGSEGNLPLAGIRSVSADKNGGLWVGTYGGGAAYRASDAETFSRYNKNSTPALETTFVSAIGSRWRRRCMAVPECKLYRPGKQQRPYIYERRKG